jgi:hypothetical protein
VEPSLESARLKLVRAEEHLKVILKTIERLVAKQGNVAFEEDREAQEGAIRIRLPAADPDLPAIAGDFLYNVRSAMDHVVYQLVAVNGQTYEPSNHFPICSVPVNFLNEIKRHRLDGVSAKAQTIIETLQPYHRGNEILLVLDALHNIDKHRTINIVTMLADSTSVQLRSAGRVVQHMSAGEELPDGAALGNLVINLASPKMANIFRNMEVKAQVTSFVAFKDFPADESEPRGRVDAILEEIFDFARNVVLPAFEPFFN